MDLFTTSEKTHCPLFFSLFNSPLMGDILMSRWLRARLYASGEDLASGVMQNQGTASVILIAPNWLDQPWFPDLREMLVAPPWQIPLRRDLCLKQVARYGTPARRCGAFMWGCFRGPRGAKHPTFPSA